MILSYLLGPWPIFFEVLGHWSHAGDGMGLKSDQLLIG